MDLEEGRSASQTIRRVTANKTADNIGACKAGSIGKVIAAVASQTARIISAERTAKHGLRANGTGEIIEVEE